MDSEEKVQDLGVGVAHKHDQGPSRGSDFTSEGSRVFGVHSRLEGAGAVDEQGTILWV